MELDYSGYWTGSIFGTNNGGFTLDITQQGNQLTGIAKISEPTLGQYEYHINGHVTAPLTLDLTPGRRRGNIELGKVKVICSLDANGNLTGKWQSEIGTEGALSATRFKDAELKKELPKDNSVFIVHGQEEATKLSVARYLEKLGVKPVILQEQINRGMSLIEKFEDYAAKAGFAVILMTPDDFGYPVGKEEEKKHRARQNVVLELGYFFAKLGRDKTIVLTKGEVEFPSDVMGIVYEKIDNGEGWKLTLARELKEAGFDVDMNQAL